MPYVIICPACNSQLKSKTLIPAGRTLVCPSCKTKFTTKTDSKEIGTTGSKASVSVPSPVAKERTKPTRNEEDNQDFEDDDRPKKKAKSTRDEEDDDRPKKGKQQKKSLTLPIILWIG